MIVVAVGFPNAHSVIGHKFESVSPLCTFSKIELGNDYAKSATVLSFESTPKSARKNNILLRPVKPLLPNQWHAADRAAIVPGRKPRPPT